MVAWTSTFTIGITNGSLNSDDVLFHPYQVFTSSFPNQPFARISRFEQERNLLERFMLPLHHTRIYFFASPQGFEPWTLSLTARCSTTELRRRSVLIILL